MKRWNYETIDESYIIKTCTNLFVSVDGNTLVLKDNNNNNNYSIFQFIDSN